MKLTSQVCTLAQAQKLKELGITQQTSFYFLPDLFDGTEEPIYKDCISTVSLNICDNFSAFTVAELCAMLLCDANEKSGWNIYWKKSKFQILYQGEAVKEFTNQAEALAYLLILLIEKGFTMPEMCNDRLLNA